jgi:hypothetical protein
VCEKFENIGKRAPAPLGPGIKLRRKKVKQKCSTIFSKLLMNFDQKIRNFYKNVV